MNLKAIQIPTLIFTAICLLPVEGFGQSDQTGRRIGERVWRQGKAPLTHSDIEHLARGVGYEGGRAQESEEWAHGRDPSSLTIQGDEVMRERLRANGLQLLDSIDNPETDLQVTLVRDKYNPTIYMIFRGTEPTHIKDQLADIGAIGKDEYENKADNAKMAKWAKEHSGNLVVTGHSLGGALAQRFIVEHPDDVKKAVLFNSPALDAETVDTVSSRKLINPDGQSKITYYRHPGDPVSELGGKRHLYGEVYTVEGGPTEEGLLGVHSGSMLQGGTVIREKDFYEWQEDRKSDFLKRRAESLSPGVRADREAAREAMRQEDLMRDARVAKYTEKIREAIEKGDYEEAQRLNEKLSALGEQSKDKGVEQVAKDLNKEINDARSREVATGPEKEEPGIEPEPGQPEQVAGAEPEAPAGEQPPGEPKLDPEGLLAEIKQTLEAGPEPEPPAEVEPTEQATKDFLANINDILKKTARKKKKKEKPEPPAPEGPEQTAEPEVPSGEEPPEEPKVDLEGLLADINRTLLEAPTPMESGLRIPQAMVGLLSKGGEPEPPAEVEPTEQQQDAEQATKDFLAKINTILKNPKPIKKKEEKPEPPTPEETYKGFRWSPELDAFIREENLSHDIDAVEKRIMERLMELRAKVKELYSRYDVDLGNDNIYRQEARKLEEKAGGLGSLLIDLEYVKKEGVKPAERNPEPYKGVRPGEMTEKIQKIFRDSNKVKLP